MIGRAPELLDRRLLFFTGKGGVGKTSIACAYALVLSDSGRRVLLVSTDPASNLDEMLRQKLTNQPMGIPGAPNLQAMNIDPEAAAQDYRDRVIGQMAAERQGKVKLPSSGTGVTMADRDAVIVTVMAREGGALSNGGRCSRGKGGGNGRGGVLG